MERITVFSIIICVVHFVGFVTLFLDDKKYPTICSLGKFFIYVATTFAMGIMIFYRGKSLEIAPIKGMCIYMIIPGGLTLLGNVLSGDEASRELVPGTTIACAGMIVAIITLAMAG